MARAEAPLVALVDDEKSIRETVGYALRQAGYRVALYGDGQEAWDAFEKSLPDLAILDILMPRVDGLELCRRIRAVSRRLPLIFLTSRGDEVDRVVGLEMGGDDYLCKPFSTRELIARVRVLFRRLSVEASPPEQTVRRGALEMDLQRHTATWRGAEVNLTVTEFRILHALAREAGLVKTREQLLAEGYPQDQYVSDRTIDSHIKRVRRKLAALDPSFDGIESIYGLGYRYREEPHQ